ncbi:hypothetical protein [Roseomonas xinghualingensis]|uniref:hypothetical protein n=1 Tax=Roseomonas xinghualingensis TaxID=2986475 RepID=UPI0021F155E3|nr:hypothetical protein [Roseomonas sp. SXEYE001]MCV4208568.1 hypothetical protein [Roseomonas sp. SXEYE001]
MTTELLVDSDALEMAFRQLLEVRLLACPQAVDETHTLLQIRDELSLLLHRSELGPDPVQETARRARLAAGLDAALRDMLADRASA